MCCSKLPIKVAVNFLVTRLQPFGTLGIRFNPDLFPVRNPHRGSRIRKHPAAQPCQQGGPQTDRFANLTNIDLESVNICFELGQQPILE